MSYLKDIEELIESIPYGGISFSVDRVNRKTVKITTSGEETLRYVNNEEAVKDLIMMIKNLISAGYTGEAHVKLEMKQGNIVIMGIFNKKETQYKE